MLLLGCCYCHKKEILYIKLTPKWPVNNRECVVHCRRCLVCLSCLFDCVSEMHWHGCCLPASVNSYTLFGWHASVVHALSNFNLYDDAVHESVDDFDDLSDAISDPTTL